jgi:predicted Fe-Mo cluster-binding NifX family protein
LNKFYKYNLVCRKEIMKICISSTGKDLDSTIEPRFGRCPFFLIIDDKTDQFEAIANPGANSSGGAGIAAAQTIADQKVATVITGNVGPNAFGVLQSAGIKIYTGAFNMTVKQAISDFKENKLQETSQPSGPNYMGMPGGMPRGGGLGRGGGRGRGRNR